MSLVSELEKLASALEEDESGAGKVSMPELAEKIAKELGVKADEVAILAVSTDGGICIFWCRRR